MNVIQLFKRAFAVKNNVGSESLTHLNRAEVSIYTFAYTDTGEVAKNRG